MTAWTEDELARVDAGEELQLASVRPDGSLRRPVTMWVVRVGDDIYVRSVRGRNATWFRHAQTQHQAHIRADTIEKDVTLIETDDALDEIDAAYNAKYGRRHPTIVPSIVAPAARAATLKLEPQR